MRKIYLVIIMDGGGDYQVVSAHATLDGAKRFAEQKSSYNSAWTSQTYKRFSSSVMWSMEYPSNGPNETFDILELDVME